MLRLVVAAAGIMGHDGFVNRQFALYFELVTREDCACITGHSLGGAIAMLAAFDVRRSCDRIARHNLWCYTFGGVHSCKGFQQQSYRSTLLQGVAPL